MKDHFEEYLKNFNLLTEDEIQLLVSNTDVQGFKKGSQISDKHCYLVLEGCVREYILKDGLEKTTAFFLKGDSLVPISNQKNERFWQCLDDCVLTVGNQDMEKEMCRLIPRLQSIILSVVQEASSKVKEELAEFISSTPIERYQNLLVHRPSLIQIAPQHQIASYIGVTPESLSRLKKRLKADS